MAFGHALVSRNATLNGHFGAGRATFSLATLYVAIFNGNPSTTGVEAAGGNYARLAVANNVTTFPVAATTGSISVGIPLEFATSTAVWGSTPYTYDHWAIYDNNTGGTLWYWGQMASPVVMDGASLTLRLTSLSLSCPES